MPKRPQRNESCVWHVIRSRQANSEKSIQRSNFKQNRIWATSIHVCEQSSISKTRCNSEHRDAYHHRSIQRNFKQKSISRMQPTPTQTKKRRNHIKILGKIISTEGKSTH